MPKTKAPPIPSALVECVEVYADAGYGTFATQQDKRPMTGCSWTESLIDKDPNMLKYPFGSFGVKLKADDLVIDLDPRNMKGRHVWSEIKQQVSTLNEIEKRATIVRTGGNGLHIYLRKPPSFRIRKHLKEFPGVDFLTEGAYVLGAGSRIGAKEYTFLTPPFSVVDTPSGLLHLIQSQVVDLGKVHHQGFSDTQDNIERFVEYLNRLAPIAIEGEHGDSTTFSVACRGRDYNLTQQKTCDLMFQYYNPKCKPMWGQLDLQRKVINAYNYNQSPPGTRDPNVVLPDLDKKDPNEWLKGLDHTKNNAIRISLKNAVYLLKHEMGIKGVFIYNEFNERLEIRGKVPWEGNRINRYNSIDDREIECIRLHLAETHAVEFPSPTMWKAVDLVAAGNTYHPIRDVLETFKWDGVPRVDSWLQIYCGAADKPLNSQMGRKLLCAMIARVYSPGCKYDYVLVLEGRQGIGKSTCCEILGGEWYGDAPVDPKNPDCIPYLHSKWVIELSEMITTRKTESDRMKNFLSRKEDDVRLPYARARQRFPRQCVFIGTINPDDVGYLTDTSGNRRFWPVFCNSFDLESLKQDRAQLLAEAITIYKKGESLTLPEDLVKESEKESMTRLAEDPWQSIIADWVSANPEESTVTTQHIYRNVLFGNLIGMHTGHQRRIANALVTLGWVKQRIRGGIQYVKQIRVEAKNDE